MNKSIENLKKLKSFHNGSYGADIDKAIKALAQEPCKDAISRKALIERINHAEENFKADNMESIASDDEDPFIDGVLSGVFNIRQMVIQAQSVTPTHIEQEPVLENATNGDMIKAMFPLVEVKEKNNGYEVYFGVGTSTQFFNHQWWNTPYKPESEGI